MLGICPRRTRSSWKGVLKEVESEEKDTTTWALRQIKGGEKM